MSKRSTSRLIKAPVSVVFDAVTDVKKFPEKSEDIVSAELLTEQEKGVGTRFRETRRMGKREGTTELECTEFVENERVRFVTDQGGTVWDSIYTTKADGEGTVLTLEMDARPHKFMARIVLPMIMGVLAKAVDKDMDAVKAYCENKTGGAW